MRLYNIGTMQEKLGTCLTNIFTVTKKLWQGELVPIYYLLSWCNLRWAQPERDGQLEMCLWITYCLLKVHVRLDSTNVLQTFWIFLCCDNTAKLLLNFESRSTMYSYFDFGLKNSSFRLPYQHPSSSADCARELFKGSNGSASLVDCTRKTIFWLGSADFLW